MEARHSIVAALWLYGAMGGQAIARDEVFVTYGADGVPSFSTQPYNDSYIPYLRAPGLAVERNPALRPGRANLARTSMMPVIRQVAAAQGLDPALVSAIVEVESGFDRHAVSSKGAVGAMQLMPATAAQQGVTDAHDLKQNLTAGARHLKRLLKIYSGNIALALAAYNAGQGNVMRHQQRIPPFNETMLYVPRVLATIETNRHLDEFRPQ